MTDSPTFSDDDLDRLVGGTINTDDVADDENLLLKSWIPYSIADARKPRPPVKWIVDRLIRAGSLSIFFGAPGHLKSMILLDLACNVAGGTPWLQPLPDQPGAADPLTTSLGGVLWVDFDNGEYETHERIQALADTYGLPDDAQLHYLTMPTPFLDSSNPGMILHLIRYIEKGRYALVIIDNLGLVKGAVEENSAEMTEVMKYQRLVAERTGAAVILVHHQRKASTNGSGTAGAPRKGESLRGHSSIEAACDLIIHVHRDEGSDTVTLTPTKRRRGASFPFLTALWTYTEDDVTGALVGGRFFGLGNQKPADEWQKQVKDVIRDVVKDAPGIGIVRTVDGVQGRMAAMTGVRQPGQKLIKELIRQMVNAGEITVREGAKVGANTEQKLYADMP